MKRNTTRVPVPPNDLCCFFHQGKKNVPCLVCHQHSTNPLFCERWPREPFKSIIYFLLFLLSSGRSPRYFQLPITYPHVCPALSYTGINIDQGLWEALYPFWAFRFSKKLVVYDCFLFSDKMNYDQCFFCMCVLNIDTCHAYVIIAESPVYTHAKLVAWSLPLRLQSNHVV